MPSLFWFNATRPAPASDFQDYLELGFDLLNQHQFGYPEATARRLPGYPLFLAALVAVVWWYPWIAMWNIALTASIGVLVYFLVRRLTGGNERVAVISGLLCAANPAYVFFSAIFASEHVFAPLFIGALLLLASKKGRPWIRALIAGIMLGCAVLTRGEALFYIPVAVLLLVRSVPERRARVMLAAGMLAACGAVVVPWYIRNVTVIDRSVGLSTIGGTNFYFAHNPVHHGWYEWEDTLAVKLGEVDVNRAGYRLGLEYLKENPLRLASDVLASTKGLFALNDKEIVRTALWVPEYASSSGEAFRRAYPPGTVGLVQWYFTGLLLLALLSIPFWRLYPRVCWVVPLGVIAGGWLCYAVIFWGKARFRYTMEAFLCILAAMALAQLPRVMARRPAPERPTG